MAARNLQERWIRSQDFARGGRRTDRNQVCRRRAGVAFMPEQITGLPHEGVVFLPLFPPLRRESTIAWRADNPSKPLKDYIQVVTFA